MDDPAKQVMSAFWNWLHHRLPAQMHNDVAVTRADLENIKRKILLSRPVQDAELESCKHEITLQLKQWRATFQPLEIPVVMWGRNFQVLDYNKTFSDICGYAHPVVCVCVGYCGCALVTRVPHAATAQRPPARQ